MEITITKTKIQLQPGEIATTKTKICEVSVGPTVVGNSAGLVLLQLTKTKTKTPFSKPHLIKL